MTEYIVNDTRFDVNATVIGYERREEIVRCRDCKYMHTVRSWLGMDVDECWLHADSETGALGKEPTKPDGYCAWGEPRESPDQTRDEPRQMEFCASCRYFVPDASEYSYLGLCHRFPDETAKDKGDYCGEYARRDDAE